MNDVSSTSESKPPAAPGRLGKTAVLIYQHIPKCGGRSFVRAYAQWAKQVSDHPPNYPTKEQLAEFARRRVDLSRYGPIAVLHGHLIFDGIRPQERYGDFLASGHARVMTIVREPRERAISAYYYQEGQGRSSGKTLEAWLERPRNVMARCLGIRSDAEVEARLGDYFWIGVTEQYQESLDLLARLLGKEPVKQEHLNRTEREAYALGEDLVAAYRERNALDYRIYEYAVKRLGEERRGIGNIITEYMRRF
jgi:hypothetical protein